ncbi:unnamed protein product [Bemisia tabaci]|uniref:BED-type domain-containing protein n=2 Tax=Bemisia tabaci TaxID=7038 RepID=A0A9P0F3Y0_BEMTA|nr:unnamed protein product [Bemisia tabaci]
MGSIGIFFDYIKEENKSVCRRCKEKIGGNHVTNLKKHVRTQHKEEYEEWLNKQKTEEEDNLKNKKRNREDEDAAAGSSAKKLKQGDIRSALFNEVTVKINLETIENACINLIINGRPLVLMDDAAFHSIIDPILEGLKTTAKINRQNIRMKVIEKADAQRKKISGELRGKMFSLKLDICTKRGRSVLGINAQFIADDGHLYIRTLAVFDLAERHTGVYIISVLLKTLKTYSINISQIFCMTTDNGSNMVKAVKLMDADIEAAEIEQREEMVQQHTEEEEEECGLDNQFFQNDEEEMGQIRGFRCAAHTLQLTIADVWKSGKYSNVLAKVRRAVKELKNTNVVILLKLKKLNVAIIDCPTRWSSTYLMLQRLISLREFCVEYAGSFPNLHLTEGTWNIITEMLTSLQPLDIATKQLQSEDLLMGDLLAAWTNCVLHLISVGTNISEDLYKAMQKRQDILLENAIFCSSVLMDPRYKGLLSKQQKEKAITHLLTTWQTINLLEAPVEDSQEIGSAAECAEELPQTSADPLEGFLAQADEAASSAETTPQNSDEIKRILQNYSTQKRPVDLKNYASPMLYWKAKKADSHPNFVLYKLAQVVLSAPATQVSVERLFSGLAFILSPLRASIAPDLLESILLLRYA